MCKFRRAVALVLLPCYLASCTTWRTRDVGPEQVLVEEEPSQVRVLMYDGSRVVLWEPHVSGDTLSGVVRGETPAGDGAANIPLSDVESVEVRQVNSTLTIVVLTAAVAGLFVFLYGASTPDIGGG
jgi:hypothetical protein